jgi:1,5-anhydro-D-fructose reductase (1,5-anhydro-D-mannitol-forming)
LVRWGMIGAGSVTEAKSGPAFQLATRSALVAVMRRTPGMAADYARRHRIARHHDDALALVHDPEVDAVYIATPPGSHAELALLACRAGKPVYLEKPMARNHRECVEINEAFEAAGLPLFVAYYRRSLSRFLAAKALLDAGTLGSPQSIDYHYVRTPLELSAGIPWRLRAELSGGGLFLDVGCHILDLVDFLFGPISLDTATALNRSRLYDVEDGVSIRFTTSGGVSGRGEWDFRGAAREDTMTVIGARGSLRMSVFGDEPLRVTPGEGAVDFLSHPNPTPIQLPLVQSIVDQLSGDGASPSTGKTAARTSLLIDQVLDAFYGGRSDAFWERPSTWPGVKDRTRSSS